MTGATHFRKFLVTPWVNCRPTNCSSWHGWCASDVAFNCRSASQVLVRKGVSPMKRQFFAIVLGITAALSTPYAASADLIFDASLGGVTGSGLGTVATILTIQSPGSTTTESGSVSRSGGADVTSNTGVLASGGTTNVGNVKTGASQTLTQTFGGNGITKASQIAIVFNADEPSGNSITLTGLQMSVFNGNS